MAVRIQDRVLLWDWLNRDPVHAAVFLHRVFFRPYRRVYADHRHRPRAALAVHPREGPDEGTSLALYAEEPEAALPLLSRVPPGPYFLFLGDEGLAPLWEREVGPLGWRGPAVLLALAESDFVDRRGHEVAPVSEENAPLIARLWSPEWEGAPAYVASRLREGLSFGVYEDGELVAWNLTHLETDRVVMMGFLHVREAHRGRGYAKSVGSALAAAILERGKVPALHVFQDNEVSLRLTESMGFRRRGVQVWGDGTNEGGG